MEIAHGWDMSGWEMPSGEKLPGSVPDISCDGWKFCGVGIIWVENFQADKNPDVNRRGRKYQGGKSLALRFSGFEICETRFKNIVKFNAKINSIEIPTKKILHFKHQIKYIHIYI